jgi:hypothetical protein
MDLFRHSPPASGQIGVNYAQGVNKNLNLLLLQKNAQLCLISGGLLTANVSRFRPQVALITE